MRGLSTKNGQLTNLGIFSKGFLDRGFMVVNQESKVMVNAKQHPKLVSVFVEIVGDSLELSVPNMKKLILRKPDKTEAAENVTVWRVNAEVFDCGDKAADWITRFLDSKTNQKFRIYYFDPENSLQNRWQNRIY